MTRHELAGLDREVDAAQGLTAASPVAVDLDAPRQLDERRGEVWSSASSLRLCSRTSTMTSSPAAGSAERTAVDSPSVAPIGRRPRAAGRHAAPTRCRAGGRRGRRRSNRRHCAPRSRRRPHARRRADPGGTTAGAGASAAPRFAPRRSAPPAFAPPASAPAPVPPPPAARPPRAPAPSAPPRPRPAGVSATPTHGRTGVAACVGTAAPGAVRTATVRAAAVGVAVTAAPSRTAARDAGQPQAAALLLLRRELLRRREAQGGVRHQKRILLLAGDDLGGGGHAGAQQHALVVDREHRLVGDDVARRGRHVAQRQHAAGEHAAADRRRR